jgi:hypothetical protein
VLILEIEARRVDAMWLAAQGYSFLLITQELRLWMNASENHGSPTSTTSKFEVALHTHLVGNSDHDATALPGEDIWFERDLENTDGGNDVKVLNRRGESLGYVSSGAGFLASIVDTDEYVVTGRIAEEDEPATDELIDRLGLPIIAFIVPASALAPMPTTPRRPEPDSSRG